MNLLTKFRFVLGGILLAVITVVFMSPLRPPSSFIRESLLRGKPLGTPLVDVEHWLTSEKHYSPKVANGGFYKQEPFEKPEVVGVKSIKVELGDYTNIFLLKTTVTAFWGFDEKERLIEVWVWKTTDAP